MLESLFPKKETYSVLLVEDDALLNRMLANEFTHQNFHVVSVENGLDVLLAVEKRKPDLILLDLVLPGIDGFEILKQLKGDKKTQEIPVIVLSNLEIESDVKSAKILGAEQYFIKANSSVEEIVSAVQKRLSS